MSRRGTISKATNVICGKGEQCNRRKSEMSKIRRRGKVNCPNVHKKNNIVRKQHGVQRRIENEIV